MTSEKRKKKKRPTTEEDGKWLSGLRDETKCSVWAIVCLGTSLFFVLAIFGKAGLVGEYVDFGLEFLFGEVLFLVPMLFFFAAISLFSSFKPGLLITNLIGGILVLLSGLALADIIFENKSGGHIGFLAALPFLKFVDFWASLILFLVAFFIGFLIMFNVPVSFGALKKVLGKKITLSKKSENFLDSNNEYKEAGDSEEDGKILQKW